MKYLVYHLRWQVSGVIMMPVLYFCANLGPILSVVLAQLIGAMIFWFIDKRIFHKG